MLYNRFWSSRNVLFLRNNLTYYFLLAKVQFFIRLKQSLQYGPCLDSTSHWRRYFVLRDTRLSGDHSIAGMQECTYFHVSVPGGKSNEYRRDAITNKLQRIQEELKKKKKTEIQKYVHRKFAHADSVIAGLKMFTRADTYRQRRVSGIQPPYPSPSISWENVYL
jgi:hypothetical protein